MAKRDKDETMKRFIDAVGEILKEKGYTGLGLNKIALQAGMDKKLIYRYFGGLNNLLTAYISGKDYWQPLLREMNEAAGREETEVLPLFVKLFQDLFLFFREEPEMQQFILWQMSEPNPLMRSISEDREREGARLLALTDSHFKNSGVHIRSVLALVLGGVYYTLLHAEHNKSTVAGVDMNLEKDRQEMFKTIGQVLSWAWAAADKKAS
jgi:AcrR family transcriptional regulator